MIKKAILVIACLVICAAASADTGPAPLAMSNKALGGGAFNVFTPGVEGGVGLNNVGLLVRTWGRVTAVDTTEKFFYIDDGSGLFDGSGNTGARVSYADLAAGNVIAPPSINQYVAVTGISSTKMINSLIRPMLRPRSQGDIQVVGG